MVAFSGGLDSRVLLHLACALQQPVRAVHVHHGLQPGANAWAGHCRQVCQALGVDLTVRHVAPQPAGRGLEAAAREARYACFADALRADECLLTAHHADDQLETVLLRLMRGTGPDGLAGIARWRAFGAGWLVRPLLDYPRAGLAEYARRQGLEWVEDPSNAALEQDRNYLRAEVIPRLQARWCSAADAAARLARHASAQRDALGLLLAGHRAQWPGPWQGPLPLAALRGCAAAVRPQLLRHWLHAGDLPRPGTARLESGLDMLLGAARDRAPAMTWGGHQIRRHGDWLYRLPFPLPAPPPPVPVEPAGMTAWGDLGAVDTRWLAAAAWLRGARAGERVRMPGRPRRALRALWRDAGILPWWRERLPLVLDRDGEVLAVIGLGLTAAGGEACPTPPAADAAAWLARPRRDGPDWGWLRAPA